MAFCGRVLKKRCCFINRGVIYVFFTCILYKCTVLQERLFAEKEKKLGQVNLEIQIQEKFVDDA
jgi:hypothetical protein